MSNNSLIEVRDRYVAEPQRDVVEPGAKQPSCLIKQEDRNC